MKQNVFQETEFFPPQLLWGSTLLNLILSQVEPQMRWRKLTTSYQETFH